MNEITKTEYYCYGMRLHFKMFFLFSWTSAKFCAGTNSSLFRKEKKSRCMALCHNYRETPLQRINTEVRYIRFFKNWEHKICYNYKTQISIKGGITPTYNKLGDKINSFKYLFLKIPTVKSITLAFISFKIFKLSISI